LLYLTFYFFPFFVIDVAFLGIEPKSYLPSFNHFKIPGIEPVQTGVFVNSAPAMSSIRHIFFIFN